MQELLPHIWLQQLWGDASTHCRLVPEGSWAGLVLVMECSACPSDWSAKLWKKLSCCCWSYGKHRTNWWGWMCCPAWNSIALVGGTRCCTSHRFRGAGFEPAAPLIRPWSISKLQWGDGWEEWHWLLKCKCQRSVWCCSQLLGICCIRSRWEVKGTVMTHLNIWTCEVEI